MAPRQKAKTRWAQAEKKPRKQPQRGSGKTGGEEQGRAFTTLHIGLLVTRLGKTACHKRPNVLIRLMVEWPSIMGPYLARYSAPRQYRDGDLIVGCAPEVMMDIQYGAPQLIKRINLSCGWHGGEGIQRMRIRQEAGQFARPRPHLRPEPAVRRLGGQAGLEVEQMAEGRLRAALLRLGRHLNP
ncbi:DUF721 domain-containing protein [Formicincola oecophyllae]|nr:DUF721 domain-containing protein [Formicincola oecophyllae]